MDMAQLQRFPGTRLVLGDPSVLVFNETDRCESFVYEGEENHP